MILPFQVTDSRIGLPLTALVNERSATKLMNETVGTNSKSQNYSFPRESGWLRNAWKLVRQIGNPEMTLEAKRLLSMIQDAVYVFERRGFDLSYLPSLHAALASDGSLLFEWISADFRIGFSIEPDLNDSGWYLVTNSRLGELSMSGHMRDVNTHSLVAHLLLFVLSNS